ncbi:MAG: metal-sulfur cluster assembly factor [Candidatus Woesearchaeota archaeon]|nr:metal-sulfur cluster assembly factor [Candidatus Woesearchaeota archaeon]
MAIPDKEVVTGVLKTVMDPELMLSIWDLGLIYKLDVADEKISIEMTLTTPLCPYGPAIIDEVKQKLSSLAKEVFVELVFEPAWEPSEEVKMSLGIF